MHFFYAIWQNLKIRKLARSSLSQPPIFSVAGWHLENIWKTGHAPPLTSKTPNTSYSSLFIDIKKSENQSLRGSMAGSTFVVGHFASQTSRFLRGQVLISYGEIDWLISKPLRNNLQSENNKNSEWLVLFPQEVPLSLWDLWQGNQQWCRVVSCLLLLIWKPTYRAHNSVDRWY